MNAQTAYVPTRATPEEVGEFAMARAIVKGFAANRRQVREYVRRLPHLKEKAEAEHDRAVFDTLRKLAEVRPDVVAKVLFIVDKADIPHTRDILSDIAVRVSVNTCELVERHLKKLACSMRS